jgi:PAT family beta-lactamase induction signal transducer AmpG
VVGYKLGMILGGGVLVWASASLALGWGALFAGMAAVTAVCLGVSLAWREPPPPPEASAPPGSMGQVLTSLKAALAAPGGGALLLFVGTYRLGEACIDAMYKPFLVDAQVSLEDYGLWVGTYGAVATVAGLAPRRRGSPALRAGARALLGARAPLPPARGLGRARAPASRPGTSRS